MSSPGNKTRCFVDQNDMNIHVALMHKRRNSPSEIKQQWQKLCSGWLLSPLSCHPYANADNKSVNLWYICIRSVVFSIWQWRNRLEGTQICLHLNIDNVVESRWKVCWYTDAETKWPAVCKRYFHVHLFEWTTEFEWKFKFPFHIILIPWVQLFISHHQLR